ncbi:WD40 repeat-like protein [Apiospora arundinis]|uniref:GPI inositol-deacylase n=1 Tax=Apiospora arundinis TaxID=335852 RepID=A0ABR2I3K0_9PEZI
MSVLRETRRDDRSSLPNDPIRKDSNERESTDIPWHCSQASTISPSLHSEEFPNPEPSLYRRFTSSWSTKRSRRVDGSPEDGVKGPLGLHLLHASPEPLIDLIFVHGLRGGSTKTWRKGDDHRLFWPRYWLPMDPGFKHASIHSFGYDSDWGSTKVSILDVHDFGNSLLEAMRTSPCLRANPDHPIVLIGHSMGGLVIKKAYIAARQGVSTQRFAQRIKCIFFLATPHRGSDYAAVLSNILKVSGFLSSKQYLSDLMTGSTSTQLINDGFARYADDIRIFSFFETQEMDFKVSSAMIVDRTSAVLGSGFKTERTQHLDANHRDVCKFNDPTDSNYIRVRDSLSSALEDLLHGVMKTAADASRANLRVLKSFLGITSRLDYHHPHVQGSCRWIEDREDFQNWRDSFIRGSQEQDPSYYFVTANPGTGKTVLAAHVASELQELNLECSHHFFQYGDKEAQSLGACLRSLAYQMANSNAAVRDVLVKLHEEGTTFDKDDARAIWVKLFKKGIFRERIMSPQYWVIDALDECVKYQELFTLMKGEKLNFPLRIFITSRKSPDFRILLKTLRPNLEPVEIPTMDTLNDIATYIHTKVATLNVETEEEKLNLGTQVLAKSGASFLWVRLVLDELQMVYGYESILQVLDEIPLGMLSYYQRIINALAEKKREKHTIQAILVWVVTSARPLKTGELSNALKLDVNAQLPSTLMKTAIEGLCGQLVVVDNNDYVRLVHSTARDFLFSDDAVEFRITKSAAHERIALNCLRLLSSSELQPPRHRRLLGQKGPPPSALQDYAISHFSDHVFSASSERDELLMAVQRFLKTNVLSWVERLAEKGDLSCITRTARNFRAYLDRRAKYKSPLGKEVQSIDNWSTDLTRLVAKFGGALLTAPSSIYFLIPPLTPLKSAVYTQFGRSADGLSMVGRSNAAWEDCIATVSLGEEITSTVACGGSFIAVGTLSGNVMLYNHRNFQKEQSIPQKFAVDCIHFDRTGKFMAVSTRKRLALFDLSGRLVWETKLRGTLLLLESDYESIWGVATRGHLHKWDLTSGELVEDQPYRYRNEDDEFGLPSPYNKAPSLAAISPDGETLALSYRNDSICLWSLLNGEFIAFATDEAGRDPFKILFNPNPDVHLFLVAYRDCHLALYDSYSGVLVLSDNEIRHDGLISIACSSDGRTFATVDTRGCMRVWDYESLNLLYYVTSHNSLSRTLIFSSDSSSIIDATDTFMRIWSPSVLVRKTTDEDMSTSEDAFHLPVVKGQYESLQEARVSAVCAHPSLRLVIAGRHNGDLASYNTRTGQHGATLYTHSLCASITALAVSVDCILASGDVRGGLAVCRLDTSQPTSVKKKASILSLQLAKPIRQLVFIPDTEFLLVSTANEDKLFSLKTGLCNGTIECTTREAWRWTPGPSPKNGKPSMWLVQDKVLKLYEADNFSAEAATAEISLSYDIGEDTVETTIVSATIHPKSHILTLDTRRNHRYVTLSAILLFDLSTVVTAASGDKLDPLSLTRLLEGKIRQIITPGSQTKPQDQLMVMGHDSWLYTVDLSNTASGTYTRHFYVPDEFVTQDGSGEVVPIRTVDDDVVFTLHGELAIVKNGTKFQEVRALEDNNDSER